MALNTPKRTFSNVKKVVVIFCLISQEESDFQNIFVTSQWKNKCSRDSTSVLASMLRSCVISVM